jgi:hypothetical protein
MFLLILLLIFYIFRSQDPQISGGRPLSFCVREFQNFEQTQNDTITASQSSLMFEVLPRIYPFLQWEFDFFWSNFLSFSMTFEILFLSFDS